MSVDAATRWQLDRQLDTLAEEFGGVFSRGTTDACPIYPGKRYEDWELEDPEGRAVDAVRRIRDDIDARVQELLGELVG
jgi:hypothetical protein